MSEAEAIEARGAEPVRAEVTGVHTQILRLALGEREARAYWEHVDPKMPPGERALRAFEERWFGAKSAVRVKTLLTYLAARFDAFPGALEALVAWREMTPAERQVVCHWHLQLSDPLYRRFSGVFLVERRDHGPSTIDRDVVLRWVQAEYPARWSTATCVQFASKLLSAASEAGLVSAKKDPRGLLLPTVPDRALAYLFYLLRGTHHEGTALDNPYLASVGLRGAMVDQRLLATPGVRLRRMGPLTDMAWDHASLEAWARETR